MNDRQLAAREGLLKWINGRTDLFLPTPGFDAEKAIPASEMRYLWKMISELFFGVDIGDGTFTWDDDLCCLGLSNATFKETTKQFSSNIVIHSHNLYGDFGKFNTLSIVSILFHEAIHAVLTKYGCDECKTAKINNMAGHHGRPYQMIATKLEEVAPILLGIPVKIGKWDALRLHWDEIHNLISRHDLAVFKLSSTKIHSWEDADVAELASRTKALCDFKPYAWMAKRYWPAYWIDQHGNYNRIPDDICFQTTDEEENETVGVGNNDGHVLGDNDPEPVKGGGHTPFNLNNLDAGGPKRDEIPWTGMEVVESTKVHLHNVAKEDKSRDMGAGGYFDGYGI